MTTRRLATAVMLSAVLAACGGGDPPTVTPPSYSGTPSPTSSSSSPSAPAARRVEVSVAGGKVTGPDEATVRRGETVELVVTADVSDEVHVHGFDLKADVAPGRPATIRFVARTAGIYRVELEERHLHLTTLRVGA